MSKKLRRLALSLALPIVLIALGLWAAQAAAGVEPSPSRALAAATASVPAAPGKLVVAVPPGTDRAALVAILARGGAMLDRWLPRLGLALVDVPAGAEATAADALRGDPLVDFVTEHRKSVRIADVPLDQYFSQQWGMVKIAGPQAWDIAWGDPGTVIAVVDTGANYLHQDLAGQYWINPGESYLDPVTGRRFCYNNGLDNDGNGYIGDCRGWNFADPPGPNVGDDHGHGTVVMGIAVAATDNYDPIIAAYAGVAGMARGSRGMILKALDRYGEGWPFDIATAMDYAVANGAKVINLSLTLPVANPAQGDVQILRRGVEDAQAAGVLIVAAAGNDTYNGVAYPAAFPGVLAVGASTPADERASFSNYGSRLDLIAPGVGIWSTLRQPGYNAYGLYDGAGSGTSFATPHVAGVAALVRALRPDLAQASAFDQIVSSVDDVGDPGKDSQTGWGRLNAYRAVYSATLGLTLTLSADPPTVAPGRPTTLTLQVTAGDGIPAGFGGRVVFSATNGAFTVPVVSVDGSGHAATAFAAPAGLDSLVVTATLGGVSATLPVSATSGLPASLELAASPVRIASGGSRSVITATVLDEGGSPVVDGVTVTFTTTLGSLAPSEVATTRGTASTILTSGALTGTALITAGAGGITGATSVEIVGVGQPFGLLLTASPATLVVGGAPAVVTATVSDAIGLPVPDGTAVHFATDLGVVMPVDLQTSGGKASTHLAPGHISGVAHVAAAAGAVQGVLQVPILPGATATVTLEAVPSTLTVGYNKAALRAQAVDLYGNSIADGTPLLFTASLGLVTPPVTTTVGGRGEVSFLGEFVAGTSHITVTVGEIGRATTTVRIRPGQPAKLALSSSSPAVTVGGQVVTLTAMVRDEFDNLAEGTAPVTLTTNLGGLRAPGGAATAVSLTVPAHDGVALAQLVSGPQAGVAQLYAATPPNVLGSTSVTFQPVPPAAPLILTIYPPREAPRGRAQVTVIIQDQYGNAVADGTMAHFAASRGHLAQVDVPTQAGFAGTELVADDLLGTISIVVVCEGISVSGSLEVTPVRIYLPVVVRQ